MTLLPENLTVSSSSTQVCWHALYCFVIAVEYIKSLLLTYLNNVISLIIFMVARLATARVKDY